MYYPSFDPIAFSIGPVDVRWYGISYVVAFVVIYLLGRYRVANATSPALTQQQWADIVFYGAVAGVVAGRIGYVLFYDFQAMFADPLTLFKIWEGGRSLHGGMLGTMAAIWVYIKVCGLPFFRTTDFVVPMVAIGIGIGRIGNFLNTELPGRITESAFGVHFPCSVVRVFNATCTGEFEALTRHVSSLYQAFVTGVIVFAAVWLYTAKPRPIGMASGFFLIAYGVGRTLTELFRQPDWNVEFVALDAVTMGQVLCIPMIVVGILLMTPQSVRFLEAKSQ